MIDWVAGLGTAALLAGAGYGILAAAATPRLPLAARIGWAYLIGLAWIGVGGFALSHLGVLELRASFVGLVALPILAGSWMAARRGRAGATSTAKLPAFAASRRERWITWSCAAVVVAVCAGVAARAIREPLADWDGRMTWAPAARWICAERTVHPTVLVERRWWVSHPDYPPLLPVADCAALALGSGAEGAEPFRLLYALQLPALLAVIWTAAARWAGRRAAWLAVAMVALAPFPAWNPDGGATGAYSDLAVAAFFGGGIVVLASARRLGDGLMGGLLLAAAVLTKKEGIWLAAGALAAIGLTALRGGRFAARRSAGLGAVLGVAVAIVLLQSWAARIPPRGDESYAVLAQQQTLAGVVAGWRSSAPEALRQMAELADWSLLWWAAPVLLLVGRRGWMRRPMAPFVVAAALPLALGAAAYALHPDPQRLVAVTWNRFLVQALAPIAILLGLALRSALRSSRRLEPAR